MFTTRDAASALAALSDARALPALSQLLGFATPVRLDRHTLRRLALGDDATRVWVATRAGALLAGHRLCGCSPLSDAIGHSEALVR